MRAIAKSDYVITKRIISNFVTIFLYNLFDTQDGGKQGRKERI